MTPFLVQLAELCRTERTRAKWVIVPTHTLGHTPGEQQALGGMAGIRAPDLPHGLPLPRPRDIRVPQEAAVARPA